MALGDETNRIGPAEGGEPKILQSKMVDKKAGNKKQKIEVIVLAVLVPIFLYLLVTTFFKRPAKAPSQAASIPAAPAAAVSDLDMNQAVGTKPKKEAEEDRWGRSPFSFRSDQDAEQEASLLLKGVVENGKEALAIINKKIVKVGDRIADKKVKEIKKGKVILVGDDGQEVILKG